MSRRIFGLETEFGILHHHGGQPGLSAEELARWIFRPVIAWGRSSNIFVENGSRLYLDVGSHPEYATVECDSLHQLMLYDRAGEIMMRDLARKAQAALEAEGIPGAVHMFKNNEDSAGHSYGCHENYLLRRKADFSRTTATLIPFLITRSIITGAGGLYSDRDGSKFVFSPRSEHLEEATSSATTRSRPMINTRDEPHADANEYRRLHVISGDTSVSEASTMVKVGMMDLILRVMEQGRTFREFNIPNPAAAIQHVSRDLTGQSPLQLLQGNQISAVDIQQYFLDTVASYLTELSAEDEWTLDLWQRGIEAVRSGNHELVATELDWAIKKNLFDQFRSRNPGISWTDPRLQRLDLTYHEITGDVRLIDRLMSQGLVQRFSTDEELAQAAIDAPTTTRGHLRGQFIKAAQKFRRDYTVDWVHIKLNDAQSQTVLLKDPFASEDQRVEKLIDRISQEPPTYEFI